MNLGKYSLEKKESLDLGKEQKHKKRNTPANNS